MNLEADNDFQIGHEGSLTEGGQGLNLLTPIKPGVASVPMSLHALQSAEPTDSPPTNERTDKDLFLAFQEGDRNALGALFLRHQALLENLATQMLKGFSKDVDGADVVSAAYIRILQKPGAFHEPFNFLGWVKGIMHHIVADYFRKNAAHPTVSLDGTNTNDESSLLHFSKSEGLSPDDTFLLQERSELIRTLLTGDVLCEDARQVMHLLYVEDLTSAEVAEKLGIPVGTVLSCASRSRTKLRKHLVSYMDVPQGTEAA